MDANAGFKEVLTAGARGVAENTSVSGEKVRADIRVHLKVATEITDERVGARILGGARKGVEAVAAAAAALAGRWNAKGVIVASAMVVQIRCAKLGHLAAALESVLGGAVGMSNGAEAAGGNKTENGMRDEPP